MAFLHKKTSKTEAADSRLQNPKILEVNLVKDQALITFDWGRHLWLAAFVLALALALVIEAYLGLGWWENQETAKAQNLHAQTDEINAQVVQLNNQINAALVYKAKAADFSALLNNHIYWTNFFVNWLEKNTLSSVQYQNFSGDLSGAYSLTALAPSYSDVAWQDRAFLNDPQTKAVQIMKAETIKSANKERPNPVEFLMNVQVNPAIFKK